MIAGITDVSHHVQRKVSIYVVINEKRNCESSQQYERKHTIKYGKPSIPQTHLLHGYEVELPKLLKENTYKLRQINSTDFVT